MTTLLTWFDWPWLLPLAVVLPVLVALWIRRADRKRRERFARLGTFDVVSRLVPPSTLEASRWHVGRLALAAALAGIAAAGPRWGAERQVVRSEGIDMVLALDASLSMMAEDERPSRLQRLKQEVRRLRATSSGDRIGIIAFAGRSYVLSPLTVDAGALDLFLDNLDPSVVGQAGSSLARAIRQGTDLLLVSRGEADKALVVMSDGEGFETVEDVATEARRAGEEGISLVTVGFGTPQGSTIPVEEGGQRTVKRDESGQTVVTRYSPDLLRAAAEAARGTFIPAEANDKAARVKQALSQLRTQSRTVLAAESRAPRFQWFLAPAVFLLLLDTLLSERRGSRRRRLGASGRTAGEKAAAAIAVAALIGACATPDDAVLGDDAFAGKRYGEAASAYRRVLDGGDRSPRMLYNYGTALVAADSTEPAQEPLDRARESTDAEVRHRALFNLGLAHLLRGLAAQGDSARPHLDAALAAYKQVLLARPADGDAKWNYELALAKRDESGGGGGGGGGGQSESQDQDEQPQPSGSLAQQQAEQLLGSAARDESDVQAKRQRQNRVEPPPGGKDW